MVSTTASIPPSNGAHRAGFASKQIADEKAFADVFDWIEPQFENWSYLFAEHRLSDYADLSAFCWLTLHWPDIAETMGLDHIKRGYYSVESLNLTKIVPAGPDLSEIF
ncbi:glutathione S-transferase domain-containing protein [Rhizobium sp. NXC14]|nr:glutathione S-transferase domain-containing protein [Rhizobium sp. NXC14]